ncbi:porin family protein [bacterium]|nr:porin family protein [bacterium]NUN47107.1 outer membrane beta-barrel protein [bacterium]
MKWFKRLVFLSMVLFFGLSLQAQEDGESNDAGHPKTKFGIGISIGTNTHRFGDDEDYKFYKTGAVMGIYVPININGKWRMEPEVSFNTMSGKINSEEGIYSYSSSSTLKISRYGVGVLYRKKREQTETYLGVRFGKAFVEDKSSSSYEEPGYENARSEKRNRSDLYLGPVAGGEYYFSPFFSIGGEAQVIYTKVGRTYGDEYEDDEDGNIDFDVHAWDTRAHLFVRWYF